MRPTRQSILTFMGQAEYRPMRIRDLARALKVRQDAYRNFRRLVVEMVDDGELVELRRKRYGLPGKGGFVTGQVCGHRGGFGFVSVESDDPDVYIAEKAMARALHGDTVMARVLGRRRGLNPEGEIVKVLERSKEPIIGTFHRRGKNRYVLPDDGRIHQNILIDPQDDAGAAPGQKVVVGDTSWSSNQRYPSGKITDVLGYPDDPDLDILSLIRQYDLPLDFSAPVLAEAEQIPETVPDDMIADRLDLRTHRIFTIDPATARDFDDAVSIEQLPDHAYRLGVHIADVSAYVPEGSLIDREANYRGTSVYLVDRVLPMLPHRLTNRICSLNPGVDRLTVSVIMEIKADGEVRSYVIRESIIHSKRRLTYEEAHTLIDTGPDDDPVVRDLRLLQNLSRMLLEKRLAQGGFDFDLPEPVVVLDKNGKPTDIHLSERLDSHRLVEECMLMANQVVARHLAHQDVPAIYRIHPKPTGEKLTNLLTTLIGFGYTLSPADVTHPKKLQQFLASIQGHDDYRIINTLIVRAMQKAQYAVENIGHYGLAFETYTHFTSPIRRYPDLLIHRLLRIYAAGIPATDQLDQMERSLHKAAAISSRREKISEEAERESIKIKQAEFMEDKVGQEFDGVVSGVISAGVFVELTDTLTDGLIPVAAMEDDYYIFDKDRKQLVGKRTRLVLGLGANVRVRLLRADRRLRQIDFALIKADWRKQSAAETREMKKRTPESKNHRNKSKRAPGRRRKRR